MCSNSFTLTVQIMGAATVEVTGDRQTESKQAKTAKDIPDCASGVSAARHQRGWQPSGSRWFHWPRGRARRWPSRWGPADC